MVKTQHAYLKPLVRSLVAIALIITLVLGQADGALAAIKGGGRIGGGSFRTPSPGRTYSAPRTYAPPGGGYYPGGGIGFPFFVPTFWLFGGGGSLFSILIFLAVASFLVQAFRRNRSGEELEGYGPGSSPTISVAQIQVGLLAEARELQTDLDKLALAADTSSTAGLAQVLQETSLALLRHPEYWTHATTTVKQARLASAEAEFNRMLLAERSKFSRETLSNVNNQLKQAPIDALLVGDTAGDLATTGPSEYIVVTLIVGTQGELQLPKVNSPEDLRQALGVLGGVPSDRLLALEVLWAPQADGDVLTREDLIVEYPNLTLI